MPSTPLSYAELQRCAAIAPVPERLACYDTLAGRPASASVPTVEPTSAAAASDHGRPQHPADNFGLRASQLPDPNKSRLESISAQVSSVRSVSAGHQAVTLDNGQVWLLDGDDPRLAAGDKVSIRHAALGSFMMETPTGRTHHVRRLR